MRLIAWVMPSSHSTVTSGCQIRREDDRPVVERQPEREHHDTELDEDQACHHHPGHLGRRRDVTDVVDEADHEDDRRGDEYADRLGVALEQHVERIDEPGGQHRREESDVHRQTADVGQRRLVDRAVVGEIHPPAAPGEHADERRGRERDSGGDGSDQEKGTEVGHGRSAYDAG